MKRNFLAPSALEILSNVLGAISAGVEMSLVVLEDSY